MRYWVLAKPAFNKAYQEPRLLAIQWHGSLASATFRER